MYFFRLIHNDAIYLNPTLLFSDAGNFLLHLSDFQITGGMDSVRKALHLVGQQLLDNPPRERDSFILNQPGSFSHPLGQRPEGPPANYHLPFQGPPFPNRSFDAVDYRSNVAPPFPKFHESVVSGPHEVPPEIIIYRLLCPNDKVGGVIGKGGSVIKNLQHETGCEIKVLETTPESEDRIIVISGPVVCSYIIFSLL